MSQYQVQRPFMILLRKVVTDSRQRQEYSGRERLATAIELAGMRMPWPPTTVVVRFETAAALGAVELIAVVPREGIHRDVYLFPVQEQ